MKHTGKFKNSRSDLLQLIFIIVFGVFFSSAVYSDNHNKINIDADALLRSLPVCAKQAKPLSNGSHHGKLKNKSSTQVYSGPSVLCPPRGHLRTSLSFIVNGQVKSSFGKSWYLIESLDSSKQSVWVPAKYITLGKKYNLVPKYTTQPLNDTQIKTDRNLNVRDCPSTSCPRLTSLVIDELYTALKKSSNNWYEVEVSNKTGWVSGQYVEIVEESSESETQELEVDVEELKAEIIPVIPDMPDELVVPFDPCKEFVAVKKYDKTNIWWVIKSFEVRQAAHEQCATLEKINIDQAVVSFGEAGNFYQLGYISQTTSKFEIGYFNKSHFNDHYKPMQLLKHVTDVDHVGFKLREAQAYWKSWQYKWDVFWSAFKRFYSDSPLLATLLVFGAILSILYAIPFTRGFARNVVKTIFQAINDIFEWLIGLFLKRKLRMISSHWNTMVEGLTITPTEFYDELKKVLEAKQLPNSRQFEIKHRQGGIFSPNRLYLRVTRENHAFDICGAPFGNGTFFSWWLGELPSWFFTILYSLPLFYWVGVLLDKMFKPETYYRHDSMAMFQSLVHSAVLEVVDQYTNEKGLVTVNDDDRKPKMKSFFDKGT